MIKIRIRNDDHEIDLQFPISENKLYAKLAEIHAIEGKDAPQSAFVTEVYAQEELAAAQLCRRLLSVRQSSVSDAEGQSQYLGGVPLHGQR